jgi:hypothetical protein
VISAATGIKIKAARIFLKKTCCMHRNESMIMKNTNVRLITALYFAFKILTHAMISTEIIIGVIFSGRKPLLTI